MTSDRFRACLATLRWSQRGLAAHPGVNVDERQVRRWAAGAAIPEPVARWLESLARFHEAHPYPSGGDWIEIVHGGRRRHMCVADIASKMQPRHPRK